MRWAFSYWSQNSGSTIIGLPKCSASVVVLLPPWVITRSTCGMTLVCGSICAPTMLSGSVIWSACGPLLTMNRCRVVAQHVDQSPHELDVGAAERTERQVDEPTALGPLGDLGRHDEVLVGLAHARVHPGPRVVEWALVEVVGLGRIDVQVGGVGARHELQLGQRVGALAANPRVEVGPRGAVGAVELGAVGRPSPRVGAREPRERRRHTGARHLERTAGHDPHERRPRGHQRGKEHDVVLDDDVGAMRGDDLAQPRLAVLGTVDERLIGRLDERRQLLDGRLAELGRRLGDEVGPELSGILVAVRGGRRVGEIDEFLDEAERRRACPPTKLSAAKTIVWPRSRRMAAKPMH